MMMSQKKYLLVLQSTIPIDTGMYAMHLRRPTSITAAPSGAILAKAYPPSFENYKIGLPGLSLVQTDIRSSDLSDGLAWERLENC